MELTFCVHVKNRLRQVQRTMGENLERAARFPGVGLVLLDYNSTDGLDAWARRELSPHVERGALIYARERGAAYFHASKSKNLAHKIAPGRVLVNLDADNFIGETIPFLLDAFRADENIVVHLWTGGAGDGTYGRIALTRKNFFRLRGYDESFLPAGYQDTDLLIRAELSGLTRVSNRDPSLGVRALRNSKKDTLRYTECRDADYQYVNSFNQQLSQRNVATWGWAANPKGWGRARLEINFEREADVGAWTDPV